MNIRILCVGKMKEKFWIEAFSEYMKRLSVYCNITVEEVKESGNDDPAEEGERLLKKIRKEDYVISTEIRGKSVTSPELAQNLGRLGLSGRSKIVFLIGGSEGLSSKVSKRADEALSFSDMTFPHQMMRVILVEQIYRSFKILRGEKYHK